MEDEQVLPGDETKTGESPRTVLNSMTLRAAVEFWRLFPGSFLPTSTWEYWRLFADSLQVRNTAWSGVGGFWLAHTKEPALLRINDRPWLAARTKPLLSLFFWLLGTTHFPVSWGRTLT